MQKINHTLTKIKARKHIGVMTHAVIGYPSIEETISICKQMEQASVDLIELQIPFSDPLADGPTIMNANTQALNNGITINDCFVVMEKISKQLTIPILCMTYYQIPFTYGIQKFCQKLGTIGISGVIIPDIPPDEEIHDHLIQYCQRNNLAYIPVISPTSTKERIKVNVEVANCFIYCTSRSGTTGTHTSLDPKLGKFLNTVKSLTDKPIAVGFGIKNRHDIKKIHDHADIAVIGSSLIEHINLHGVQSVQQFVTKLCQSNT